MSHVWYSIGRVVLALLISLALPIASLGSACPRLGLSVSNRWHDSTRVHTQIRFAMDMLAISGGPVPIWAVLGCSMLAGFIGIAVVQSSTQLRPAWVPGWNSTDADIFHKDLANPAATSPSTAQDTPKQLSVSPAELAKLRGMVRKLMGPDATDEQVQAEVSTAIGKARAAASAGDTSEPVTSSRAALGKRVDRIVIGGIIVAILAYLWWSDPQALASLARYALPREAAVISKAWANAQAAAASTQHLLHVYMHG